MEVKDVPFWAFNCAYLAFLAPTLYHLAAAHASWHHDAWRAPALPLAARDPCELLGASVLLLAWLGALCPALRAVLARLGWKQGAKPPEQHKDDAVRMAYVNVSLAILARVQARVGVVFCASVALYAAFFSVLFEMVRHVNLHIGDGLASNPRGLWIVAIALVVLLGVLHAHVRLAFAQDGSFGWAYTGWIVLALAGHFAVHKVPLLWLQGAQRPPPASPPRLHVHHWYWTLLAAHFAIFDSALSSTAQALFLGVYIHGVACFGLEPIYEPAEPDQRRE